MRSVNKQNKTNNRLVESFESFINKQSKYGRLNEMAVRIKPLGQKYRSLEDMRVGGKQLTIRDIYNEYNSTNETPRPLQFLITLWGPELMYYPTEDGTVDGEYPKEGALCMLLENGIELKFSILEKRGVDGLVCRVSVTLSRIITNMKDIISELMDVNLNSKLLPDLKDDFVDVFTNAGEFLIDEDSHIGIESLIYDIVRNNLGLDLMGDSWTESSFEEAFERSGVEYVKILTVMERSFKWWNL